MTETMWCTFALLVSLVVFVLSWRNHRDTEVILREARGFLDEVDAKLSGPCRACGRPLDEHDHRPYPRPGEPDDAE